MTITHVAYCIFTVSISVHVIIHKRDHYFFIHHTVDAFDVDLVVSTLAKLKEGSRVDVPVYDFATHSRAKYAVSDFCYLQL